MHHQEAKKSNEDHMIEINSLSQTLQQDKGKLETTTYDLISERGKVAELTSEVAKFKNVIRDLDSSFTHFQKNSQDLSDSNSRLMSDITETKSSLVAANARIVNLETALEVKADESKDDVEKMIKEMSTLKAEKSKIQDDLTAKEAIAKDEHVRATAEKDSEWEIKLQDALQTQKSRYETRLLEVAGKFKSKYDAKIGECVGKWQAEVAEKDQKWKALEQKTSEVREVSRKYEERYTIAKKKLETVVTKMDEVSTESKSEVRQLKATIARLEAKIQSLEARSTNEKVQQDNHQLQREVKLLRSESRSLKVQNDAADAKIRELQKTNSKSSSALDQGFKMPSAKNTPGRTRASRTQSEIAMARRPPVGAGSLFATDDEAGEMFSNSYLSDLKEGRCSLAGNDHSRISELSRRNTMQPAHLQSSYPAETQFRPTKEFKDDDLRHGNITEVNTITDATANMSMDSPAMNTRRASSIRLDIPCVNSKSNRARPEARKVDTPPIFLARPSDGILRGRKRPSLGKVDIENHVDVVKRARKELSYSKPGPPTPARKHNRSINSSLNRSNRSTASNQSVLTTGSNVSCILFFISMGV
jgi:predicted  nucleic acid-binding Zn-ribbon protein